ncbi:helix-turn-helix domain-containing protein [Streptomyces sp. NPDC020141]|uniref:helix-turn-helix domain-containing protein n=1 Tax=Streptomyces sp. NPDC020141 TaxID=3365065 RepID=UPI0037A63370
MEHLTQRAVATMRERYHEPLGLDDLARSAMVSKFYFLRVFRRTTGVTPGRFLAAVRLHEAKRLLVSTSFSVADVSARVCYSSAGTFSRRFTAAVGLSPTQYRRVGRGGFAEHPGIAPPPLPPGPLGTVSGTADVLGNPLSPVRLGVFDGPILQGRPVAWSTLDGAGPFHLGRVPPGTWYLHAVALGSHLPAERLNGPPLLVGTVGPVQIDAGAHVRLDLAVQQENSTHPPVLLALPDLPPPHLSAPPAPTHRSTIMIPKQRASDLHPAPRLATA